MAVLPPVIWKKRVLVPSWIARICLMIFILVIYAISLRGINNVKDVTQPAVATVVIFMLFIVIVLLIDILAIVLFLRNALKPGPFLTMNCFQTSFWGGVLIIDLVSIGRTGNHVGIGFSGFVFFTFIGLLIYSFSAYNTAKRAGQLGDYAPAHNPAAPAGVPNTEYHNGPPYQNTEYQSHAIAPVELHNQYPPPYQGGASTEYYQQQPVKPAHMV
ncbi:hypothetical protein GQ44DRAFT_707829 [Phaeosphaeriaceae sp. PMI808]|nr:hypothetical protein GQ44DRAFT_707829 [Phaeosphaeriaceae sp. PMI808]